ncbi:MAG: hypothetical protein J6W86_04720, partial [Bacteroidales bacterium]|nr:hypothetical protein [Bacteroidales bacterium]
KVKYEHLKTLVTLKAIASSFSDTQLSVLDSAFKSIDKSIASVDSALKYYKLVVDIYRDKR